MRRRDSILKFKGFILLSALADSCIRVTGTKVWPPRPTQKSFVCGKCGRSYLYQKSLIKHLKYECGIEPQFPCPYCAHRCKQRVHLVKHVNRIHLSELPPRPSGSNRSNPR